MNETLIEVFVGRRRDGTPRFEALWVEDLGDGSYRLSRTPKLALGLAREDVFRVDELGNARDVRPGGYYAFQVVLDNAFTRQSLRELIDLAQAHGGTLDVHDDIVAGLAVPDAGVDGFLIAMDGYLKRRPGTYWNAGAATPETRDQAD